MRVALAADHAGFPMKEALKEIVSDAGHNVLDLGTDSNDSVDYPDFAERLALAVRDGSAERGILLCGSGVGASVAANKVPGVRAGLCHDTYAAHQGVEHDDIQVLVLGARVIGIEVAKELVAAFLSARFTGEERHARRLAKVIAIEERFSR
ncbi:MAG: ribose 5-phosphate isomerase B [Myxococcota bacterium]